MAMAPEGRLSLLCLVSSAYYLLVLAVEMERTETVPQHAIPLLYFRAHNRHARAALAAELLLLGDARHLHMWGIAPAVLPARR